MGRNNLRKKEVIIILIILIILASLNFLLHYQNTPILGESCGTVNPLNQDECCYKYFKDNKWPECLNPLIFYDIDKAKCSVECGGSKEIACTEEAKQCSDNTFTSRTPTLNCKFIPCGYN